MITRLFGAVLAAFLMLMAMASSPMRQDRPAWGPRVRVNLWNPWIQPLENFKEQEKGEALASAWLRSSAPPDPRACIGVFSADDFVPETPVRFLDGSTAKVAARDLDSDQMSGSGGGPAIPYISVRVYAHTQGGLLVYDRARRAWGWVARDDFDDVETSFIQTVLSLRDEAMNEGIQDGGDSPSFHYSYMWIPWDQAAPTYRYSGGLDGKAGAPSGSLAPPSPIWPLAVDGDFILVVPGEISPRDSLIQKPIVYDASPPLYLTWHPRQPVWIRWREDGPVPGSKRILIQIGDF